MIQEIKFGDVQTGQEFTLGNAHYRKSGKTTDDTCPLCQGDHENARCLDEGLFGYVHFCTTVIVTVPAATVQVSDDLTMEIYAGHAGHPRYRFIRLTSKVGAWATEDTLGFVGVTFEEIPALVRALLDIQPCRACAVGGGECLCLHTKECPEHIPF